MNEPRRVELEPAWVLHRYPYRETSLIVEALTRDHGRVGLVARGARRRPRDEPLAPFAPLVLSFRQRGELGSLTAVESAGRAHNFTGNAFLAACYVNELVLRLLVRDDPAPEVYRLYSETLAALGAETAPAVRRFEGRLIRALGFPLPLTHDVGGAPLAADRRYRYDPERGPEPVAETAPGYSGAVLAAAAAERFDDPAVLAAAGEIFRVVIAYHLGGRRLKSLEVTREMIRESKKVSKQ